MSAEQSSYTPDTPDGHAQPMALDAQQALLLDVVRRARGERVSYEELRDAGVEYPAAVVSELELAGLPLERCSDGSSAACRLRETRLEQQRDEPDRAASAIADIDISSAAQEALERTRRALAWLARRASVPPR